MSAFICNHHHINAIVSFGVMQRVFARADAQDVAQMLLTENAKSVDARYGAGQAAEFGVPLTIRFREVHGLSPVQIIKACQCLAYQSCEHREWEASKARLTIDAISKAAIRALPGYSDAAWELDAA